MPAPELRLVVRQMHLRLICGSYWIGLGLSQGCGYEEKWEGQHEQVPAYSVCIRTTFIVCIRRGEITGAASRGKQPNPSSEDDLDPCRCFWNKPADRLFLRSQPRLLRWRCYQYPCYQTTRTRYGRDRSSN